MVCSRSRCKRRASVDGLCKTHETARRDRECRAEIMERDNRTCRRCGSTQNVQWAHVYSRRYRAIRHDPRNSMCLCSRCHLWQTHHPLEGEAFFRELLGDEVMDELRRIALENLP